VHVLGRDYQKSGPAVSLAKAQRASAGTLVIVEHGRVVTGNAGTFAPTVIYVEDGDKYTPYELEGGP
jgi:diaminopimelate decarboxylase